MLSEAQRRNLEHVLKFGRPLPRSRAGYTCRIRGWSEFLWEYTDGSIASTSEQPPNDDRYLVKVVGERITEAGRRALKEQAR